MKLTRYHDVAEFYGAVEHFLLEHEAEHNLLLGITTGLIKDATRLEEQSYFAKVEEARSVVAAAIQTPPHNLVISLAPPETIRLIVDDVHQVRPTLPGVLGPQDEARSFAQAWRQLNRQPYQPGISQRIYQLERVTPVRGVAGELRRATQANLELLIEWFKGFDADAFGVETDTTEAVRAVAATLASTTRGLYLWNAGQPVSMAGYSGPTPNGVRIGRVYTPPHLRGRGYASACVAALSQRLLDSGRRYCFLFTDLGNPTSNHIYQRIGYQPVARVDEYLFQDLSPHDS